MISTEEIIKKPNILFVGPALGVHPGFIPCPMEVLLPFLQEKAYDCRVTSSKIHRVQRLLDIILSVIRNRNWADIVCLQIYARRSFIVEDIASWLAERFQKKIIMVLHPGIFPNFIQKYPRWTKRVLRRAKYIIAPSGFLQEAVEKIGFDAQVIPNLVVTQDYPFHHRQQIKPDILWMRSFYYYYNPHLAIDTFRQLKIDYPNATLTMAGKDKGLESDLKKYASDLGLSSQVRFPGFLTMDLKQRVFSKHDIFINTNDVENFGISIVEAGAFGLPIVATNVGGIPYLFTNEKNALLVPPNDPVAMAEAIIRIIKEPGLANRLSLNGRKLAESCSPEVVIPLWERVLDN